MKIYNPVSYQEDETEILTSRRHHFMAYVAHLCTCLHLNFKSERKKIKNQMYACESVYGEMLTVVMKEEADLN